MTKRNPHVTFDDAETDDLQRRLAIELGDPGNDIADASDADEMIDAVIRRAITDTSYVIGEMKNAWPLHNPDILAYVIKRARRVCAELTDAVKNRKEK